MLVFVLLPELVLVTVLVIVVVLVPELVPVVVLVPVLVLVFELVLVPVQWEQKPPAAITAAFPWARSVLGFVPFSRSAKTRTATGPACGLISVKSSSKSAWVSPEMSEEKGWPSPKSAPVPLSFWKSTRTTAVEVELTLVFGRFAAPRTARAFIVTPSLKSTWITYVTFCGSEME